MWPYHFQLSSCRKLKGCWQKFSRGKKAGSGTHPEPWEADYELLPCEGLFHEYLEMGEFHGSYSLWPWPTLKCNVPLGMCVGCEIGLQISREEMGWQQSQGGLGRFGEDWRLLLCIVRETKSRGKAKLAWRMDFLQWFPQI